jgi:DNA helicase IV
VQPENEFVAPHFEHSTGGKGVDRPPVEQEAEAETGRIRRLHALLTTELAAATGRARGMLAAPTGGELSARWERDVSVHRWSERVGALTAARSGLCFGRLDHTDEPTSYIGRIGLTDPADGESALVDWRAPAARPFYCATLATPLGVTRRRHFQLAGTAPDERVAAFHDDVLDGRADSGSASDPALLAALKAPRGSTMRDIVTTIQAEQDAIIRLPLSGVVVIEGGPGTGKTAVALHRVAYLLYTHRERHFERCEARQLSTDLPSAEGQRLTPLARSGVLVVGPSAGFIRYVGGVLPALGESAVVFTTPGRLAHGVVATAVDPDEVAAAKGGLGMLEVLRRAVADRQELPGSPIAIELDDVTVEIDRAMAREARTRARAAGLPHNAARATFRDTVGRLLVDQGVERLEQDLEDPPEFAELLGDLPELAAGTAQLSAELRRELRDDLRSDLAFHAAVEQLWPVLTPEQVLAELFASPDRLASAAGGELDLSGLHRADGSAWTVADAPLLDELAELLGPPPESARADESESGIAAHRAYAAEVLGILESADRQIAGEDPDEMRPTDFVTADVLAARQVPEHRGSVAERAAADRDWRFGHLVVDEAQELSAMDWHVLLRRCPAHSITAVGDLAQRSAPAGARTWADVLAPQLGSRWTYRTLTVNYRTPAEIMALAARVLADFAPDRQPPESVRATGEDPWERTVPAADLAAEVRRAVDAEAAQLGRGTLAVIAADLDGLAGLPAPLHTPVSAKGLEFDVVVIVDPERIRAHNPADLYVSITRATRRLGLLHVRRSP